MTPFERINRCICGGETDRPPVAFWRHFPELDQTIDGLVSASIDWQKYGFDFLKIMPSASYCMYDWGLRDIYQTNLYGFRSVVIHPILEARDWFLLSINNPLSGKLGEYLKVLQILHNLYTNAVPVFATIFSPLSQALYLAGKEKFEEHVFSEPDAVLAGLQTIANNTCAFIDEILRLGIAGIYWVERAGCVPFTLKSAILGIDQIALKSANLFRWNILHLHQGKYDQSRFGALPFHVLNHHSLHDQDVRLDLRKSFSGALCGGLRRDYEMGPGMTDLVVPACHHLLNEHPTGFVLGADCGLRLDTPEESVQRAAQSVFSMF